LILATKINHQNAIRGLLRESVQTDPQDDQGNTALHYAVKNKATDIVSELLLNFADHSLKNHEGKSPLQLAHDLKDKSILNAMENRNINFYQPDRKDEVVLEEEENEKAIVEDPTVLNYLYPSVTGTLATTYESFPLNSQFLEVEKAVYSHRLEGFPVNVEENPNERHHGNDTGKIKYK